MTQPDTALRLTMTLDCRRLAFLMLILIAATRAPSAAQPAGGQSETPQPVGTPPATAQPAPPPPAAPVTADRPPGPFALDVRLAMPSFNTGSSLADPLGLRTDQLPSRGWGLDVGAHVYPVRGKRFALGVGAEIIPRLWQQGAGSRRRDRR